MTITPADFYTDELIDYHSRDDVSVNESKPWVVWIHDTSTTCCNSNCDGGSKIVAVAKTANYGFCLSWNKIREEVKRR